MTETVDQQTLETFQSDLLAQYLQQPAASLPAVTHSYYRSQVFTALCELNPLVRAAAPLLTLASRLKLIKAGAATQQIHHLLAHELKAFESQAQSLNCHPDHIFCGHYVIAAFLDEMILYSETTLGTEWQSITTLLPNATPDQPPAAEQFFVLLTHFLEDPVTNIDMLELMYICLSLGFRGKYRDTTNLDTFMLLLDDLFHIIQQQRGKPSSQLYSGNALTQPIAPPRPRPLPLRILLLTLLVICCILISFNVAFKLSTTSLSQQLNQISQPASPG